MRSTNFEGLIAAVVTPMTAGGEINLSTIDAYANYLIKRGVNGVFVCGTTGEGLLLNTVERKKVIEEWMKYSDNLKILVHVGSTSHKIAGELAKHAQEIGVDAVSCMGPCYLPPRNTKELVDFNKLVAENAPDIPYYYYHIPNVSGVSINMLQFLKEGQKTIPNLRGLKYTSYNTMEEQECINYEHNKFDILHGHDESLLLGLTIGGKGGIGTSYNVSSVQFNKILSSFKSGNITQAAELQHEANQFIKLLLEYENSIVSIKAILNIVGIDCGPCRLPLRNLSSEEMKSLENRLKEFDLVL